VSKQQNKRFLYLLSGNEPSTYVRALVYKDEYKKRGIHVDYFQLSSKFYSRQIKIFKFIYPIQLLFRVLNKLHFLSRQHILLRRAAKYDAIIAIKYIESKLLKQIKVRSKALIVYDFDDAVWLDMFFGEDEFSKKISSVDCVTSDNSHLANYASTYNKNSFIVNGPCQIEKFIEKKTDRKSINIGQKVTLGWVGSPSTLFYLYNIYDALEYIGEKYSNVVLKLVGTGKERLLLPPFEKIKVVTIPTYDQNEMIKQVYSFDIGLYPLFLNELSLGRGSLKATIYMSGGIPLVCSAFGENKRIVTDGINGFLAKNTNEWVEKLSALIENSALRKEIGENGFRYAEDNYSIRKCLDQFLGTIE
jgi:glycosyltransferase involved in cell wall biosynthesis